MMPKMSLRTVTNYVLFFALGYTLSATVIRVTVVSRVVPQGRRVQHVESPIPPDLDDFRASAPQQAQRRGKNHEVVRRAFSHIAKRAKNATVLLIDGERPVALATVVRGDGWLVSKASELSGDTFACRMPDGTRCQATKLGVDDPHDLAVLKLEQVTGLEESPWSDPPDSADAGSLVFATANTEVPIAIGIVSIPLIDIPRHPGVLGIRMEQGTAGPQIVEVLPGGAAETAGLQTEDMILAVNDKRVRTVRQLGETIREYWPDDRVRLSVQRDNETKELEALLSRKDDLDLENREFQHELGGPLSRRRSGFGQVIQHDCIVMPEQCGGPLVDVHGRVIGINIARAERIATYALPAKIVQEIAARLIRQAEPTLPAATSSAPR